MCTGWALVLQNIEHRFRYAMMFMDEAFQAGVDA